MDFRNLRIGQGYDIHQLTPGKKIILGGLEIPSSYTSVGHSDADVLTHALCDALLGAANLGDLGTHFPSSDQKYKGISSLKLLSNVMHMLEQEKFAVVNIDVTVILEIPKLIPYINQIKLNLSKELKIDFNLISIKAKTKEQLDAVGESKGIECFTIVLLYKIHD